VSFRVGERIEVRDGDTCWWGTIADLPIMDDAFVVRRYEVRPLGRLPVKLVNAVDIRRLSLLEVLALEVSGLDDALS